MADNKDVMNWDDAIEKDGDEYVVLPEGDYPFKVVSFERGRFQGGEKITACPEAVLRLEVG